MEDEVKIPVSTTEPSMRRVLDGAQSMLGYWDRDLRCQFANKAYARWFGVDAQGLVGSSIADLLGSTRFALNEPHIRAALCGEKRMVETESSSADGVQRHGLVHYMPDLVNGQILGFVVQVTDVTSLKETKAALGAEATERERVNELLRKSEAALRQAQRLGQIGSWRWEIGPDITTWSEELYRIFGRDPSSLPPSYAVHGQLYTLQSWSVLQSAVARTLETGEPFAVELEYIRSDGTTGWNEGRGAAERDKQGAIVALHGTSQEISLRRGAREASRSVSNADPLLHPATPDSQHDEVPLHLSEPFTRRVLNNLFSFVGVLTVDGTLLETNRAPLEAASISPDQVFGKKFWDAHWFSHSLALQTQVHDWCLLAAQGEMSRADIAVRMAGDTLMWIDFQIAPLRNAAGEITHLIPSATDISARREYEDHMRLATETTGVGIWEWHLASGRVRWSAQMFRMYGIAPTQDGFVSYDDWHSTLLPEESDRQAALLQDTVRSVGTGRREFHIRRRDDGQCRTIQSVETVRTDPDGQVQWVVGTNLDVTLQRELEDDLNVAARRKDEFLATLAHELRNPLAPISNSLALMERANGDVDLLKRARTTMERQVAQMVRLIDDLLDVSRITRDQLTLKRERIDLASIVHLALEICQPHCERNAQSLSVALPPTPIYLNADPMRLAQVFGNLLNNASKFTPKRGRIELFASVQGEEVAVTVKDTGMGIEIGMQSRVFELFTQVDAPHNSSAGGLGIGLALAKRITELHGGSIAVFSEGRDRGSAFVVQLPTMNEAHHSTAAPPLMDAASPTASRRILVVDDNLDGAHSLAALLALDGHDILIAHDGLDAVAKAAAFRPHVILLDIGLPKLNGFEACRRIREQPAGKDILMIAMTGWGQTEDRHKSSEAGFDIHCVKPVSHAVLVDLLTQARAPLD
jgi:PAS domain S-box-containing protein